MAPTLPDNPNDRIYPDPKGYSVSWPDYWLVPLVNKKWRRKKITYQTENGYKQSMRVLIRN